MNNKTPFSPASAKGYFDGLVDDGKYLRPSSLYKQILPRTPSRPKIPVISAAKNLFNLRSPLLVKELRTCKLLYTCRETFTDVMSALQIHIFMQNKAKFRKSQMNVNSLITSDYEQMDTWSIRKKQSQTNPNKAKTNPTLADKTPIQTQFKPRQSQFQQIPEVKMLFCLTINRWSKSFGYYTDWRLFPWNLSKKILLDLKLSLIFLTNMYRIPILCKLSELAQVLNGSLRNEFKLKRSKCLQI
jgi:hypothetical protein